MFSFKLADTLTVPFTCFCRRKSRQLKTESEDSAPSISMIAADLSLRISNLTPNTDNVRSWNIFVIGKDGHYLLTSMPPSSPWRKLINQDILDTPGNKLNPTVKRFLDEIWDSVKLKTQAMLYTTLGDDIFFMNVHVIRSIDEKTIGAIAFARPLADIIREMKTVRASVDKIVHADISKSELFKNSDVL